MILRCNFEELNALRQGAKTVLGRKGGGRSAVAAPPEGRAAVQALLPRLRGDLVVNTLAEQQDLAKAVTAIVDSLREEMEIFILSTHPADEGAVSAYFAFAHSLTVLGRVAEMGQEMEAIVELVTGRPPTPELIRTFVFPN